MLAAHVVEVNVRNDGSADTPRWLPCLLMMSTDAEADLAVRLESTVGGGEAEAGRAQRVGGRQNYPAVVKTLAV